LKTQNKISLVEISKIVSCQSDINNTKIYLLDEDYYVTKPLKHFASLLESHSFIRTHQSHLVNKNFISEYIRKDGGYLVLRNGYNIPVAQRRRNYVLNQLA